MFPEDDDLCLKDSLYKSKLIEAGFQPLPSWQDAVSRYLKEADL